MPIEYSWIQKNVFNIISDGVSLSGEGQSSEEFKNAPSIGSGYAAEAAQGVGQSSYGIKGPNASLSELSKKALTLEAIDNLVNTSGAQDGGPYSSILRQRIVEIAASYVGLYEALPSQNPGWWDKDYEAKFKKLNPKLVILTAPNDIIAMVRMVADS
jgi:hypothetical protein